MYVVSGFEALIVFGRKVDVFYLQHLLLLLLLFPHGMLGSEGQSQTLGLSVIQVQLHTVLMSHQLLIKLIKGPHFNLYTAFCFEGWYMGGEVQHRLLCQQSFLGFSVVGGGGFCGFWFFTAKSYCSNPHFSCLLSFSYLTCSSKRAMAEHV